MRMTPTTSNPPAGITPASEPAETLERMAAELRKFLKAGPPAYLRRRLCGALGQLEAALIDIDEAERQDAEEAA